MFSLHLFVRDILVTECNRYHIVNKVAEFLSCALQYITNVLETFYLAKEKESDRSTRGKFKYRTRYCLLN